MTKKPMEKKRAAQPTRAATIKHGRRDDQSGCRKAFRVCDSVQHQSPPRRPNGLGRNSSLSCNKPRLLPS